MVAEFGKPEAKKDAKGGFAMTGSTRTTGAGHGVTGLGNSNT